MSDIFEVKVKQLITEAVASLDPDDRAWRVNHCRETGQHGVQMFVEPPLVRFEWAGLDLAIIEGNLLTDDSIEELPRGEWTPEAPDTVPEEWGGNE